MPNPAAFRSRAPQRPRVAPSPTVDRFACRQPEPSAKRVECGRCGKTYSAAAVVDGPVVIDSEDRLSYSVIRELYCDHCSHIQVWRESANAAGAPLGVVLSGPGYIRSAKTIEAFLRNHPHAAGVE